MIQRQQVEGSPGKSSLDEWEEEEDNNKSASLPTTSLGEYKSRLGGIFMNAERLEKGVNHVPKR